MPNERNWNLTSCSNQVLLSWTPCASKTQCAMEKHLPQPLAKHKKNKNQQQQQLKLSDHMVGLTFGNGNWISRKKWTVIKPNCAAYHSYHYSCSFLIFSGLNKNSPNPYLLWETRCCVKCALSSLFRSPEIFRDSVFLAPKHFWFVMVLWKPALVVTCWSRQERCTHAHVCRWQWTRSAYLLIRRNNITTSVDNDDSWE